MRDQGPRPVMKIRHVKSSRVDPRVSRATGELAPMVKSHIHQDTSLGKNAAASYAVYGSLYPHH